MPPAGGRTTPPIFFPEKENGRCDRPKERRLIGSPKLEQPLCLRNATVCVRRSRVSFARRFASASTTRCCSADLAQVQPNRRLPIIRYRGERSNAAFRRQSAAKQTSLAPHDSKARLQNGDESQGFMAKPCTPHPIAQRVQLFKLQTHNVGGRGELPSSFSGGYKGGYSLREENTPLDPRSPRQWGSKHSPFGDKKENHHASSID